MVLHLLLQQRLQRRRSVEKGCCGSFLFIGSEKDICLRRDSNKIRVTEDSYKLALHLDWESLLSFARFCISFISDNVLLVDGFVFILLKRTFQIKLNEFQFEV